MRRIDVKSEIEAARAKASTLAEQARQERANVGRLLAELRAQNPVQWATIAGVDKRTGELLIGMALGTPVHELDN